MHITGITTGKIVDFGIKDSNNMGAAMAPAAYDLIKVHAKDFETDFNDYDKVITGDLGVIGRDILLDMLRAENIDIADKYMDCGIEIYDSGTQDSHSGGSGCGCSAITLCGLIMHNLINGIWKKVLFVADRSAYVKRKLSRRKYCSGHSSRNHIAVGKIGGMYKWIT